MPTEKGGGGEGAHTPALLEVCPDPGRRREGILPSLTGVSPLCTLRRKMRGRGGGALLLTGKRDVLLL